MRLDLGLGKTEIVIFAVSEPQRLQLKQRHCFILAGQHGQYVEHFKYQGCHVHERWLFGVDCKPRALRLLVQTIMMRPKMDQLNAARSVRLGLGLYDV